MQGNGMLRWLGRPGGGLAFLAVAVISYGIAGLLQGDFAAPWQPIPHDLPFRQPLAFVSAGLLVLGGAGLLFTRTVQPAAVLLLTLFALYDACYLLQVLGGHDVGKGVLGLAEQSSVVVGSWAVLRRIRGGRPAGVTIARIVFGVCSILFAFSHFMGLQIAARMVPPWIPGGQVFWALATGVGHLAVGLSLIADRVATPATRLGALMYVCFALFVWFTGAVAHPTEWLRWSGVAISLCMAAALWLVGDLLAAREGIFDGEARVGRLHSRQAAAPSPRPSPTST
jgi:uncharacterized membrane protein